jgi:hypothetical protein
MTKALMRSRFQQVPIMMDGIAIKKFNAAPIMIDGIAIKKLNFFGYAF